MRRLLPPPGAGRGAPPRVARRLRARCGDLCSEDRPFPLHRRGWPGRERYRLTSIVPALRERELVSGAWYQGLFRRYISRWGDGSNDSELRAEVTAPAVVAAHNRVLRRSLRGESLNPELEIEQALATVHLTFATDAGDGPTALIVVPQGAPMMFVEAAVRNVIEAAGPRATGVDGEAADARSVQVAIQGAATAVTEGVVGQQSGGGNAARRRTRPPRA